MLEVLGGLGLGFGFGDDLGFGFGAGKTGREKLAVMGDRRLNEEGLWMMGGVG